MTAHHVTASRAPNLAAPRDARGRYHWTRQKVRERADLAEFQAAKRSGAHAAAIRAAESGHYLVRRAELGTAWAHPGVTRRAAELRAACFVRSTGQTLSDGELAILGWVAALDLGLARGGGALVSLDQLRGLVGCSLRTAGTRVRRLVALGVLERLPHYTPCGGGHHVRGPNVLRVSTWVRELVEGKTCQAGRNPDQTQKKGSAARGAAPQQAASGRGGAGVVASGGAAGAPAQGGGVVSLAAPAAREGQRAADVGGVGTSQPRQGESTAPAAAVEGPTQKAPEGEGHPLARTVARLRALVRDGHTAEAALVAPVALTVAGLQAALVTQQGEDRQRRADAAQARAVAWAWTDAARRDVRGAAVEMASRHDDDTAAAVVRELVSAGLADDENQAAAQWRDAVTHSPRCSCAVCSMRRRARRGGD